MLLYRITIRKAVLRISFLINSRPDSQTHSLASGIVSTVLLALPSSRSLPRLGLAPDGCKRLAAVVPNVGSSMLWSGMKGEGA